MFKFLLGFAKLFMKAKIIKRVKKMRRVKIIIFFKTKSIKHDELTEYISPDNLDAYFGGEVHYDHLNWLQARIDEEEQQQKEL